MFDSVIGRHGACTSSLRASAAASVAFHAALFSAAVWISARALTNAPPPEDTRIIFYNPPRAAHGNSGTTASSTQSDIRKGTAGRVRGVTVPKPVKPASPVESPETLRTENAENAPGDPQVTLAGAQHADPSGTCVGKNCVPGGPPGPGDSAKSTVMEFTGTMRPPRLLEGEEIAFTREALEAHARGTMLVQCTITVDGRVTDCNILKSVPLMERAVLRALSTRRYTPVLFEGKPMPVRYTFAIQLVGLP